jgi:NAD(P)-dependent dehydrogenase (short-subunit alcohol dehydrogenase family)
MREGFAATQAIPHMLEPADVVGTVLFLLSDASRYVTGQTIVVDAGKVHN